MESGINKLIIDLAITGHHPTYIRHILQYLIQDNDTVFRNYYLVFSTDLKKKLEVDLWGQLSFKKNVHIIFVEKSVLSKLTGNNILDSSIRQTKHVLELVEKYNIQEVILLNMNPYQYGLIRVKIPKSLKISGIIFSQYFRQNKYRSIKELFRFIKRKYLFKFLINKSHISNVFILNDRKGIEEMNKKLKTNKIKYLPDPIEPIEYTENPEFESKYSIPDYHKVLLHYGSFDERKGSVLILDAFENISNSYLDKFTLIYAGRSNNDRLQKIITKKIALLKDKNYNIINLNNYIEKQMTDFLFNKADICLIPYSSVEASSGSLGLSVAAKTLIIGPDEGLLGELIRETSLGYTIKGINTSNLLDKIEELISDDKAIEEIDNSEFLRTRAPWKFSESLLK